MAKNTKDKTEKTNAMRMLDQAGIEYVKHETDQGEGLTGVQIAALLDEPVDQVYKTLVTVGKSGEHYVFIIPVASELDLKKAAQAVGEKNIEMIKSKELLPLTGYIHGGCSPIGMKKFFKTIIDETAELYDTIYVSGGRVGLQVELAFGDLKNVVEMGIEDLTK